MYMCLIFVIVCCGFSVSLEKFVINNFTLTFPETASFRPNLIEGTSICKDKLKSGKMEVKFFLSWVENICLKC